MTFRRIETSSSPPSPPKRRPPQLLPPYFDPFPPRRPTHFWWRGLVVGINHADHKTSTCRRVRGGIWSLQSLHPHLGRPPPSPRQVCHPREQRSLLGRPRRQKNARHSLAVEGEFEFHFIGRNFFLFFTTAKHRPSNCTLLAPPHLVGLGH